MRFLKWLFLVLLALFLVTVALANRGTVELRFLPPELAQFIGLPNMIAVPLYLVIFAGIGIGLVVGYIGEWLREHKIRVEAARAKREASALEREVKRMRRRDGDDRDDVIALIEGRPGSGAA